MLSSSWRYSPERDFGGRGIWPREFLLSLVLLLSVGFFSKGWGRPGRENSTRTVGGSTKPG
jgi:hypothetical protein